MIGRRAVVDAERSGSESPAADGIDFDGSTTVPAPDGRVSAAAIAVVNGTESAIAMPPTKERASSTATVSVVIIEPNGCCATENNNSSGRALPA